MNTHFIEYKSDGWIKGIKEAVPNLTVGQKISFMLSKEGNYQRDIYRIVDIETTIGKAEGVIIQNVYCEKIDPDTCLD